MRLIHSSSFVVSPRSQGGCRHPARRTCPAGRCCRVSSFHQDRMKATQLSEQLPHLSVDLIDVTSDEHVTSIATLRACSFYVVPAERSFAGRRYQEMKAAEEISKLQEYRDSGAAGRHKQVSIAAVVAPEELAQAHSDISEYLFVNGSTQVIVGTLDVVAAPSVEGEFLRGHDRNAAYMINVCVADVARRRGVGKQLVQAAVQTATSLGARTLYVHLMAVNEVGRALYESMGFTLEQEETSNQAHYRGQCLDGVEGLGRTTLMKLPL